METKEQKLAQIDELIKCLDIPREEVIKHLQLTSMTNVSAIEVLSKTNNPNIKPGMFWHEGNLFSFERLPDKKIKAVVELVEDGVIYGDLTASELFDIPEKNLTWDEAVELFLGFSYPCEENEKIVWYNIQQLQKVYDNYNVVKKTFEKLHKSFREGKYWSFTESPGLSAWILYFNFGFKYPYFKFYENYFRPVLALKVE